MVAARKWLNRAARVSERSHRSRYGSMFREVSQNVQIGHNANAMHCAKTPHLSHIEVSDISGAKDIGPSVRSSIQNGIIGGI